MKLTRRDRQMLDGEPGEAARPAMLALVLPANPFADELRDAPAPSPRFRGQGQ